MIVKPRDNPTYLLQMEALSRRVPKYHPQRERIIQQAKNLRAGYNGEKSLDFILIFLPENEWCIFHSLRLKDAYGFFQIDTLLLTSAYALIVEVKNIYGTITFDDLGQSIRTKDDGTEQGFNNPVEQVNLQVFRLRKWLKDHQYPALPLERLVVYSNSHTILRNITNCDTIATTVLHKEGLLGKIDFFSNQNQAEVLAERELDRLSDALIAAHTIDDINVLSKYGLKKCELLSGVFCPECVNLAMSYSNGKWTCSSCVCVSKEAHIAALEDYRLLIGEWIKNKEARVFLKINSVHVMKRLLMKAGLEFVGQTSARMYILPEKK